MLWYKCGVCNSRKSKFIKEQEAKGLLSSLVIRTPFSKFFLSDSILFEKYKMNEIINTILLAGNQFIPELHLRQPQFTCSACWPSTKNKERIKRFKETAVWR